MIRTQRVISIPRRKVSQLQYLPFRLEALFSSLERKIRSHQRLDKGGDEEKGEKDFSGKGLEKKSGLGKLKGGL